MRPPREADESGLDSVGFWDHYHSEQPDWGYLAGWSAHAWLAALTMRIRILPMVLCNLNHELGQRAKETSTLAIASGGRFELGIGAGDMPAEYRAWGRPFPDAVERMDRLGETIDALRELWTGQPVSRDGRYVRLDGAICAPAPAPADRPRVVVGVGNSRRMLERAVAYADEVNVYVDSPGMAERARELIADAGRPVAVSGYRYFGWDLGPDDMADAVRPDAEAGLERMIVNVGFGWDKVAAVRALADAQQRFAG